MDLPTHYFFGLAVGLVFFGKWEVALLIGLAALLPDLDREYWYVKPKTYADEQYHRARWHNIFAIALGYLGSPFLGMGIFLHMLQDSFTTAKDRGVEWFYPLTRLVKRGIINADGTKQPSDPKERVYFYQEDPKGIIEHADKDLREPGPVPWRRVYGFAQNGNLLDRGFLFGSMVLILVWALFPSHFAAEKAFYSALSSGWMSWVAGYGSVALMFAAGETERRDKAPLLPRLKPVQKPLLAAGILVFMLWVALIWGQVSQNLSNVFADPAYVMSSAALLVGSSVVVVWWMSKDGKTTTV